MQLCTLARVGLISQQREGVRRRQDLARPGGDEVGGAGEGGEEGAVDGGRRNG